MNETLKGFERARSWFNQGATLVFAEGTGGNRQKKLIQQSQYPGRDSKSEFDNNKSNY
jgi:hypothetical protein